MATAHPRLVDQLRAELGGEISPGGLRLLLIAALGLGDGAMGHRVRVSAALLASAALIAVVVADLWSVERRSFVFAGTAGQLFAR